MATTRSASGGVKTGRCLSCGVGLDAARRRYCSIDCRTRLRRQLNLRTGLLRALNTRFATFYITPGAVVLDVLPFDAAEIFSFICTRSPMGKPVDDFNRMANALSNAWWSEKRRTNRNYRASQHVLQRAARCQSSPGMLHPRVIRKPMVNGGHLIRLRLDRSALGSPELERIIKSAYRTQAKRHHPDMGGSSADFRKIKTAYEDLARWADNPTFSRRAGFPDKWFYDGLKNRWVQPTPI